MKFIVKMSFNDKKLCCSTMKNTRQHFVIQNILFELWWIFTVMSWLLLKKGIQKGFLAVNELDWRLALKFVSTQHRKTFFSTMKKKLWRWKCRDCSHFTEIVAHSKYQNYFTQIWKRTKLTTLFPLWNINVVEMEAQILQSF